MDRPSAYRVSWRVGVPHYETDAAFARLLGLVGDFRLVLDEVALFDSVTHHLYLPLEALAERASIIERRLAALRREGIPSVGINVLATIGHINEAWDYMPPLPFQPMVGHDGSVSRGCACPNTLEHREYVRAKYGLMAGARPDFVWVDDDIRMHNHGVAYACFCPTCLALFAEETGREYDREGLVRALNDPEAGDVRREWVDHNVRTIESLLADVGDALRSVNPEIATGLMTAGPGWTTYSGHAFDRWFRALGASKARPGGGFYSDAGRLEVLLKVFEVARQRVALPDTVTDCQYELENFPYQALRKAAASVVNECTLSLAAGLKGVAVNALPMWGPPYDDQIPVLHAIACARPMWELLAAHVEGLPLVGLWGAWRHDLAARRRVLPGEDWFGHSPAHDINRPNLLAEIGVPMGVEPTGCGTILCGRVAEAFDDAELAEMLTGGVLMDTAALQVLADRGLDHLVGVRVSERRDNGMMERFTDDPLNGEHVGQVRDARIEFWGSSAGLADELEPTQPGVRTLAVLEDYFQRPRGACLTVYENPLGGRVAVMGYAPWMFVHSGAKRCQLLDIADWISREALPVRIQETVPLVPLVRLAPDRSRGAVVLLNTGLEKIATATLHLRVPDLPVHLATPEGVVEVEPQRREDGLWVELHEVEAWTTVCLLLGSRP